MGIYKRIYKKRKKTRFLSLIPTSVQMEWEWNNIRYNFTIFFLSKSQNIMDWIIISYGSLDSTFIADKKQYLFFWKKRSGILKCKTSTGTVTNERHICGRKKIAHAENMRLFQPHIFGVFGRAYAKKVHNAAENCSRMRRKIRMYEKFEYMVRLSSSSMYVI